jgi:hypothetical protein
MKNKNAGEKCFIWWCEKGQGQQAIKLLKNNGNIERDRSSVMFFTYTTARSFFRLEGRGVVVVAVVVVGGQQCSPRCRRESRRG